MRAVRWAVAVAALCLVVAVVAVAYAAGKAKAVPVAEVVRAKRVELVDAQGRIRGYLGTDRGGRAGLWLLDEKGSQRAALRLDADGSPTLAMSWEDGRPRGGLALLGGTPVFVVFDKDGWGWTEAE